MSVPAVVAIPIRSFDGAKTRLSGALSSADRRRLAEAMAERVVRAAHDLPVVVVTDDPDVGQWAEGLAARVIAPGVRGLNASVQAAVLVLRSELDAGARVIVAHADLPLAHDLRVVHGPGMAIAPDTSRDGSNVMSLPVHTDFTFHYGPGSFAAHCAEATRRGLDVRVVDDDSLALDVDEPADLAALAAAEQPDDRRRG